MILLHPVDEGNHQGHDGSQPLGAMIQGPHDGAHVQVEIRIPEFYHSFLISPELQAQLHGLVSVKAAAIPVDWSSGQAYESILFRMTYHPEIQACALRLGEKGNIVTGRIQSNCTLCREPVALQEFT